MALGKQNVRAACPETKLTAGIQVFYEPWGVGGGCRCILPRARAETRCKESQFYILPFGQAVANVYKPTSHFN